MTPNREKRESLSTVPFLLMGALDEAFDAVAVFTADESAIASQIVYVNEAHLRLSGYSAEELLGHSSVLLAGAQPDLAHVREIEGSPRGERFEGVTRKYRPDGTAYVVEMRLAPLRDAAGSITHMLLTQRDLTARRAQGADARSELVRAETVATGRLAAGAAYEIEGPLARLSVNVRAALAALVAEGDHDLLADLQEAANAVDQIEATVQGLRAFAAVDDAPLGVDVHEAIEIAAHFARAEISERATLRRQYAPIPRARGSIGALTRALTSLLRNAAESIPRATPWANGIVVQTSLVSSGGSLGDDGFVAIDVSDTGVGIEAEDLPFVFDPFFTTKPRVTSPGLGLAAAHAAIVALGGTITVESAVGRGSRFRILLPRADSVAYAPLRAPELVAWGARRVLGVVETAADARRLRELVDDGETHLLFATCRDALERLSSGEEYDLVLCDARASARLGFREQLARLAPHALSRTFELALRTSPSGTFVLHAADAHVAASGGGH